MEIIQSRRRFLAGISAAGATSLVGVRQSLASEPPPETTRIRLIRIPSICQAPQYVAEELLRSEGFTEVHYLQRRGTADIAPALASGEADLSAHFAAPLLLHLEAGDPIVILAGLHVGCFELFGTDRVQSIRDLKGKTVAVPSLDSSRYVFLASMTAYVGLDLHKDIHFVTHPGPESIRLLSEGKIDAYLGFPPEPQEMREQQIGHVVISSTVDRPWSQYFCCMLAGSREFVRTNPVATKRALRAILKAADFCTSAPEQSAQFLVEQGYTKRYDHALQVLKAIPYGWREYSAEDTLRFYALRLHEVGMLESTPQKLLAQGTDWRFFNELKHELKT
ncbi:ABC transporter substrate-binding protein [Mesorhizobium sp. WSM4303]|uniref:ABC transporter substrate-binding protein n=1 Tax=unclassified Mesorhizobium TaxID=325217 RepID=UPI00115E2247|nr:MULTISPECIES: ABC transporter substrate-binding protein [unclassified Mesorhizobium]TRC89633.1 ABC transporter substrate-binding protein [Mesorhizobium sp. WSM4306]TRC96180.1 ABC transporter substrate-binding protein [Mesorhizobium sp. WSM4303]